MSEPREPDSIPVPELPELLGRANAFIQSMSGSADQVLQKMGPVAGLQPGGIGGLVGSAAVSAGKGAGAIATEIARRHTSGSIASKAGEIASGASGTLGTIAKQAMDGLNPAAMPIGAAGAMAGKAVGAAADLAASGVSHVGDWLDGPSLPEVLSEGPTKAIGAAAAGAKAVMNMGFGMLQAGSPGGVLGAAAGVAQSIGTGVGRFLGGLEVNDFVQKQVSSLLDGISFQASLTLAFTTALIRKTQKRVDSAIDSILSLAVKTAKEIGEIPSMASEMLEDAKQIKKTAFARRDALRKHAQRYRARRGKLGKVVASHLDEFTVELEEELELDAIEAEKFGEKVEKDAQEFYDKTVADAEFYGRKLLSQTEQNHKRVQQIKRELSGGEQSAKDWAKQQGDKARNFINDRTFSVKSFGTPWQATAWASEALTGAHRLASEIRADLASKPKEIKSFGERRYAEAAELASGLKQEVQTAQEWAATQTGNNAAWKRAMKENRQQAESFLTGQASRVLMKVTRRGEDVGDLAQDLAKDQLSDTSRQIGDTIGDAKKLFDDIRHLDDADRKNLENELAKHSALDLPEPVRQSRSDSGLVIGTYPVGQEVESEDTPEPRRKPPTSDLKKPSPKVSPEPKEAKALPSEKESKPKEEAAKRPQSATALPGPPHQELEHIESKSLGQEEGGKTPVQMSSGIHPEPSAPVIQEQSKTKPEVQNTSPAPTASPKTRSPAEIEHKPPVEPDSRVPKGSWFPPISPKAQLKPTMESPSGKSETPGVKAKEGESSKASSPKADKSSKSKGGPGKITGKPATKGDPKSTVEALDKKPTERSAIKTDLPEEFQTAKFGNTEKAAGPQRKPSPSQAPIDPKAFEENLVQAGGSGEAPDTGVRSELSKHVGFDPAMVRFHTGPAAQAAATALSADAFTIGSNIFFGPGKFDPRSPKGLGLIGHEVQHVGQQLGLKGNKLRFHTQAGGDAMEQEAQEVGERIAANIRIGSGIKVGRFVRTYEPADDEPITTAVQIRLDQLSMKALAKAGQVLSIRARSLPVRLDEVSADVSLDLESCSDAELIEIWAEAIVSAVEAAHPTTPNPLSTEEVLSPATHVLQARLGDPGNEPKTEPPKVDPEVLERIAKVTATSEEKEMIRKLLVRKEVDSLVDAAMKKRRESYVRSLPPAGGGVPSKAPTTPEDSDRGPIEAKLKEHGINSFEEFEKLKTDFVSAFQKKGFNVTKYILEENKKVVQNEKSKYLSKNKKDPDAPINTLKTAAKELKEAMTGYMDALERLDWTVWYAIGAHSYKPAYNNLDTVTERIASLGIHPDNLTPIQEAYRNFMKVRQAHGNKHPLLLGRDFDPHKVLNAESDEDLEMSLFWHFKEVEDNIDYALGDLTEDKFWELHPMVAMTKKQMGVRAGEGADITIQKVLEGKANDAMFWGIIQAAAAIALAITAMVATGGLAAVAMVGSAGLSVYSAAKSADDYMFKSAAVNSSLDQATLISKDDPSLLWLALELVGAGLDVAGAIGAFGKIASIARRATMTTEKEALQELDAAARSAYKNTKGMSISEDDFVARLLESAKKGADSTKKIVAQSKLAIELLEGTSARAVAIMKNNEAAIQSLVTEYGNWKGLMGALSNGGNDAELMASNISAWRNKIVAQKKAEGASPLSNASTEAASDFDLNVTATKEMGAGERVLMFEKQMADAYGPNWSEALLMNFYPDKSILMSVEAAMEMVPAGKRAAIMARVNEKSELLNFAKMLEHAGDSEAARKQVLELMETSGVKYSLSDLESEIARLGGGSKEAAEINRANKLKEVDAKIKELDSLPPNDPKRAALAEQVTELQMEANFLSKEAYIGPGAVKSGPLTMSEAYQSALSQLEMMSHVIHECGGDILKACREYEFYKYVQRYTAAAKSAKVESPALTYFEGLAGFINSRARKAHSSTGHLPGNTPVDEALTAPVDPEYLLDTYNMFKKEVEKTLPQIKEAAEKNPAGRWTKEMPKTKPAAGSPAGGGAAKGADAPPIGTDVKTTPPADLKKGVALPAAAVKTAKEADKMMEDKGKKGISVGPHNAVKSAGFSSSKTMMGIGMFKGRIPGVDKDVLITVMSIEDRAKFETQLSAALAAAKTGFGPKVHGKVEMGEKKLAFATDDVEGGIADAHYDEKNLDPMDRGWNRQDMMENAKNIKAYTFQDVERYRDSIWESGFYYVGPVDGFVTPDGHWKPVNFHNASPFSEDTDQDAAWKLHAEQFDTLRNNLMKNSLDARGKLGKGS